MGNILLFPYEGKYFVFDIFSLPYIHIGHLEALGCLKISIKIQL